MNNNWEFDYSELYNNNNPGRNAQNTTAPEAESPLQGAPGPAGMPGMGVGGAPVPPHAAQKKRGWGKRVAAGAAAVVSVSYTHLLRHGEERVFHYLRPHQRARAQKFPQAGNQQQHQDIAQRGDDALAQRRAHTLALRPFIPFEYDGVRHQQRQVQAQQRQVRHRVQQALSLIHI